jgi:hypothetical protein
MGYTSLCVGFVMCIKCYVICKNTFVSRSDSANKSNNNNNKANFAVENIYVNKFKKLSLIH